MMSTTLKVNCRSVKLYGVWGSVTVTIIVTLPDFDVFIVRLGNKLPTQSSFTASEFVTYCNSSPTVAKVAHVLALELITINKFL